MLDLTGMWVSIGVLCAAVASMVVFAMYKQLFGVIELPERKLETVVVEPPAASTSNDKAEGTSDEVSPPYVYEQQIQVETST